MKVAGWKSSASSGICNYRHFAYPPVPSPAIEFLVPPSSGGVRVQIPRATTNIACAPTLAPQHERLFPLAVQQQRQQSFSLFIEQLRFSAGEILDLGLILAVTFLLYAERDQKE